MSLANNKALSCSNCGGQLEYNYTQEISKCLYCGSEFKRDEPQKERQDKPQKSREDKSDQRPRFVEKPTTIPEENKVIYDMVFSPRPKFWKAFLWGLGAWACWMFISPIIGAICVAVSGRPEMPNNIFSSMPWTWYWFLRGIIFCLVWPFLRTRVFYKRY
ncbi:hypothetical protein SAMN05192574_102752 [Mucilaginibacter gossypiicola]|uniref:Uncharacterized protein n=1 Tax=Mucilaginibacter gossypiicola TaxID=551995 RepID=A0A1H8EKP3_9SPHI|nr:hypothetical protein [Mucilaginibacter gossypiicola]SEN20053.1 hypothetical protein SAMN05192574_102752 [Mucilaginibacter gossypiicola]